MAFRLWLHANSTILNRLKGIDIKRSQKKNAQPTIIIMINGVVGCCWLLFVRHVNQFTSSLRFYSPMHSVWRSVSLFIVVFIMWLRRVSRRRRDKRYCINFWVAPVHRLCYTLLHMYRTFEMLRAHTDNVSRQLQQDKLSPRFNGKWRNPN